MAIASIQGRTGLEQQVLQNRNVPIETFPIDQRIITETINLDAGFMQLVESIPSHARNNAILDNVLNKSLRQPAEITRPAFMFFQPQHRKTFEEYIQGKPTFGDVIDDAIANVQAGKILILSSNQLCMVFNDNSFCKTPNSSITIYPQGKENGLIIPIVINSNSILARSIQAFINGGYGVEIMDGDILDMYNSLFFAQIELMARELEGDRIMNKTDFQNLKIGVSLNNLMPSTDLFSKS
jgi:hypothetical protein